MRDFKEVMEKIKKEIPESFDKRDEFIMSIDDRIESYHYTAPEIMGIRWKEAASILSRYIPEPKEEWQINVAKIFNGTKENCNTN